MNTIKQYSMKAYLQPTIAKAFVDNAAHNYQEGLLKFQTIETRIVTPCTFAIGAIIGLIETTAYVATTTLCSLAAILTLGQWRDADQESNHFLRLAEGACIATIICIGGTFMPGRIAKLPEYIETQAIIKAEKLVKQALQNLSQYNTTLITQKKIEAKETNIDFDQNLYDQKSKKLIKKADVQFYEILKKFRQQQTKYLALEQIEYQLTHLVYQYAQHLKQIPTIPSKKLKDSTKQIEHSADIPSKKPQKTIVKKINKPKQKLNTTEKVQAFLEKTYQAAYKAIKDVNKYYQKYPNEQAIKQKTFNIRMTTLQDIEEKRQTFIDQNDHSPQAYQQFEKEIQQYLRQQIKKIHRM